MGILLLGLLAALAASALYNVGVALQALEARHTPASHSLRLALLGDLVRRPLWLAGMACVAAGWLLQAGSLMLAPLTVVQPTLAAGLVVLLVIGMRYMDELVNRREVLGIVAIVAGVAGLTLAAPRGADHAVSSPLLAIALVAFGAAAVAPYVLRAAGTTSTALVVTSAGLAYAWCGLSTKLGAAALEAGSMPRAGLWLASTAVAGGLGLLSEMTALQERSPIRVFPIVLVIQIVVAVVLAPLLGGESWGATPLGGLALLVALGVLAAGTAALASGSSVGAALHGGPKPGREPA